MQTPQQLNDNFAIEDYLVFDEPHPGMPRARITTAACTGEMYLQGAHLTAWQPAGEEPVLFLSENSAYTPGKAIRGGIPVIFPWFGAPSTSPVQPPAGSPSHGFARTSPWTLRFAALAGEELHLSLTLDSTDASSAASMRSLQLGLDIVLGRTLTLRLTAANASDSEAVLIEEALHTYLRVGALEQVAVEGLEGTDYLDKTADFARKTQRETALRFAGEVDRPYLNTTASVTLVDRALGRRLVLHKEGSRSTVTWNPGASLAAKLPDLVEGAWQRFVCIETANVAEDAVRLAPRETHTMTLRLRVEPLSSSTPARPRLED